MQTPVATSTPLTPPRGEDRVPYTDTAAAFILLAVGCALSVAVMIGLLGLPLAGVGLVVTMMASRRLVGMTPGFAASTLASLAGLATSGACLGFAASAAGLIVARSMPRAAPDASTLSMTLLAWVAAPVLGWLAFGASRSEAPGARAFATVLWLGTPPATAALVWALQAAGLIALTA